MTKQLSYYLCIIYKDGITRYSITYNHERDAYYHLLKLLQDKHNINDVKLIERQERIINLKILNKRYLND